MKWIWNKGGDAYVDFFDEFAPETSGQATLFISASTDYAVYINGQFVEHSQYPDYPFKKVVEQIPVTVSAGKNELKIVAYHMGAEAFTHYNKTPALAYEIVMDGKVLATSSAKTMCVKDPGYEIEPYFITPQLGAAWRYDFRQNEGVRTPAIEVETGFVTCDRPSKKCVLTDLLPVKVCAQGIYKENGGETMAERMQFAFNSPKYFHELTDLNKMEYDDMHEPITFKGEGGDGLYVIIDLLKETAGFLHFDIEVDEETTCGIGWGEHLTDLRPRTHVGPRYFAIDVKLKKGRNVLDEYFHRWGCRYLSINVQAKSFKLNSLTLREQKYPFTFLEKDFGDIHLNQIYEVGRRTLELCAHEHYEDCPWREQALYGMDSRNQMLFGYGAFGEYTLPRASLRTLAYSIRECDLLSITAPANQSLMIPTFSLYYIMGVCENAEKDYNDEFVKEMIPYINRIMGAFQRNSRDGAVLAFPGPDGWNFYEWITLLDSWNRRYEGEEIIFEEGVATALYAISAKKLVRLFEQAGDKASAEKYASEFEKAKIALQRFYNEEGKFYHTYINGDERFGKHVYMQALMAEVMGGDMAKHLCSFLKNKPDDMVGQTLATLQWTYDAILKYDGDIDYCIEDIKKRFGTLVNKGLTSFPETEKCEDDFGNGGSLCHAWSSVPCYVLDNYYKK